MLPAVLSHSMVMLCTLGVIVSSFNGTWSPMMLRGSMVILVWFLSMKIPTSTCAIFLGYVFGLDVSLDGSVVVGGGWNVVIAHNTATGAVLWRKEMPGRLWTLRIHGGVVVVPVDNSHTVVLEVTTGHQLHTLPSAGEDVCGICVFDGLTSDVICFVDFLTPCYHLSAANEGGLEGG